MAGQARNPGQSSPSRASKTTKGTPRDGDLEDKLARLTAERDELSNQLKEASKEITHLRRRHEEIANQIEWALDSLHTVIDEKE